MSADNDKDMVDDVFVIDQKVKDLLEKGYEVRRIKIEVQEKVAELIEELKGKYPNHEKEIASSLEGARMEIQHELEIIRLQSMGSDSNRKAK